MDNRDLKVPEASRRTDSTEIPLHILIVLAMAAGFGPFALDTYLPGLPAIAEEFGTSASLAQVSLSGFAIMLGFSQIVAGPLSDQLGRRKLLLLGLGGCAVASFVCSISTSIWMLIAARIVQGVFGATGIVVSRAMAIDMGRGVGVARAIAVLMSIQAFAPAIAPLAGGLLIPVFGWRSAFWFLVALNVTTFLLALIFLKETLPEEQRSKSGISSALRNAGELLRKRRYVLGVAMVVACFVIMFSYLSASSFILQQMAGLSQREFSVVFVINAFMVLVGGMITTRLVSTYRPIDIVGKALILHTISISWLAVSIFLLDTAAWAMVIGFFLQSTAQGFLNPNLAAVALSEAQEHGGTGAALMGSLQFGIASLVAPLTGIGGGYSAVPMVVIMLVGLAVLITMYRASRRAEEADSIEEPEMDVVMDSAVV